MMKKSPLKKYFLNAAVLALLVLGPLSYLAAEAVAAEDESEPQVFYYPMDDIILAVPSQYELSRWLIAVEADFENESKKAKENDYCRLGYGGEYIDCFFITEVPFDEESGWREVLKKKAASYLKFRTPADLRAGADAKPERGDALPQIKGDSSIASGSGLKAPLTARALEELGLGREEINAAVASAKKGVFTVRNVGEILNRPAWLFTAIDSAPGKDKKNYSKSYSLIVDFEAGYLLLNRSVTIARSGSAPPQKGGDSSIAPSAAEHSPAYFQKAEDEVVEKFAAAVAAYKWAGDAGVAPNGALRTRYGLLENLDGPLLFSYMNVGFQARSGGSLSVHISRAASIKQDGAEPRRGNAPPQINGDSTIAAGNGLDSPIASVPGFLRRHLEYMEPGPVDNSLADLWFDLQREVPRALDDSLGRWRLPIINIEPRLLAGRPGLFMSVMDDERPKEADAFDRALKKGVTIARDEFGEIPMRVTLESMPMNMAVAVVSQAADDDAGDAYDSSHKYIRWKGIPEDGGNRLIRLDASKSFVVSSETSKQTVFEDMVTTVFTKSKPRSGNQCTAAD